MLLVDRLCFLEEARRQVQDILAAPTNSADEYSIMRELCNAGSDLALNTPHRGRNYWANWFTAAWSRYSGQFVTSEFTF